MARRSREIRPATRAAMGIALAALVAAAWAAFAGSVPVLAQGASRTVARLGSF